MELSDALKQQLAAKFGSETSTESAPDKAGSALSTFATIAQLAETLGAESPQAETPLKESGLGSLERIELGVRIEQELHVELDDRLVASLETFGDLSEYVEKLAH